MRRRSLHLSFLLLGSIRFELLLENLNRLFCPQPGVPEPPWFCRQFHLHLTIGWVYRPEGHR